MPEISTTKTQTKLEQAIFATLAFFSLYELPLSSKRVHELLFGFRASPLEIDQALLDLSNAGKIVKVHGLYSTKNWNQSMHQTNQLELMKKWDRVDRYFHWLAVLPFVRNISVINSLALGTANSDSDIDFFVIANEGRLYFVRSMIIVLFRLLGVYKTREKIKDKFCFGFFTTPKSLEFEALLLKPADPYFMFWLSCMRPVVGGRAYWQLMQRNHWLLERFPNFEPMERLSSVKKPNLLVRGIKLVLEILLYAPAMIAEPILRHIHVSHTFKLAENRSITSTTIANAHMLKLHGYDVRAEVAEAHRKILENVI